MLSISETTIHQQIIFMEWLIGRHSPTNADVLQRSYEISFKSVILFFLPKFNF